MFTQTARLYPTQGKGPEVRALVTERVKRDNEMGAKSSVRVRILSDDGPTLVVASRFESLTELDERRRARAADAGFQAHLAQVVPMLSRPIAITIQERLVAPAAVPGKVGLLSRAFFQPVVGRGPRLRELLEQRVKENHAAGQTGQSLWMSAISATGTSFILNAVYEDMAGFEKGYRDGAAARAAFGQKISELIREPVAARLFEVLVPYPRS